jgi:hypothetical protein
MTLWKKRHYSKLAIYSKDIQRITKKSEKFGRKLIRKIMEDIMKGKHQPVRITEFCRFYRTGSGRCRSVPERITLIEKHKGKG